MMVGGPSSGVPAGACTRSSALRRPVRELQIDFHGLAPSPPYRRSGDPANLFFDSSTEPACVPDDGPCGVGPFHGVHLAQGPFSSPFADNSMDTGRPG